MWKNIHSGIRFGLFFGGIYSAYVLVVYLFAGSEPFEKHGLTLGEIIVVYMLGGIVAGSVVGLLRPLAKQRRGSMLVGVAAALPICAGMGFTMFGSPGNWDSAVVMGLLVTAVLLGSWGGYFFWEPPKPPEPIFRRKRRR